MLVIPKPPKTLKLSIGRLWNGERCPDSRLSAVAELQKREDGLFIKTTILPLPAYKAPEAPIGSRLENLDAFERICLFFVEEGGQYLEAKLGIGGQYLILGFDAPHKIIADFSDINFSINHQVEKRGIIINEILILWEFFPAHLSALNAFLVVGSQTLAYHPIPGNEPDFHRPNFFPFAKLEE